MQIYINIYKDYYKDIHLINGLLKDTFYIRTNYDFHIVDNCSLLDWSTL